MPSTPSTGSRSARCRSTAATEFREGFGPLLPGCDPVGFGDLDALARELERGDVAAFIVEPIQGKGVNLPAPDYLPARPAPVPRGRRAVRVRRGADGHRAHRALPGARALGPRARHGLRREGAVGRVRADRRGARLARGVRARCSTAWSAPCGTARRSAATISPRRPRWRRCGCSSARQLVARCRAHGRAAARADAAARRALRGRQGRARAGADVGDRIRAAGGRERAAAVGARRAPSAGAVLAARSPCRCSTSTGSSARSPATT